MLLTSFSQHRPNPIAKLNFSSGALREGLKAYSASRGNGKFPKSFQDWPDSVIAAAVHHIVTDVRTAAPTSAADRFFEASLGLANYLGPVAIHGPWQLDLGRVHVSLVVGPPNPSRPSQSQEVANPQENSLELELTPEAGDSPLSPNPDIAATQALNAFNDRSSGRASRHQIPWIEQVDDDALVAAVRLLQPHCDAAEAVMPAALLGVGLVMAMEEAMAEFASDESQAEFARIRLPDDRLMSAHIEVHRSAMDINPARSPRP